MDLAQHAARAVAGQTVVQIEGLGLDALPDWLVAHGLQLQDVYRPSYLTLQVGLSYRGAKKALRLLKDGPFTARVVRQRGLPATAGRLHRRWLLAVGLAAAILVVGVFSSRVWQVSVVGCSQVPEPAVRAMLEQLGYSRGMAKSQAQLKTWQRQLMLAFPLLQWVGLELDGVELVVRVVENSPPPQIEASQPGDLVAQMDGVVKSITVRRGVAAVSVGDHVRAGQVLIRGQLAWGQDDQQGTAPAAADGQVIASVYRQASAEAPIDIQVAQPTGQTATARFLRIGNFRTQLSGGQPFDPGDQQVQFTPFGGAFTLLPVGIETVTYRQLAYQNQPGDLEVLQQALAQRAESKLLQTLPPGAKIIDKRQVCDKIQRDILNLIVVVWVEAEVDLTALPAA